MIRKQRITPVHTTSLEAGPTDGPPLIFVRGWPGLAVTWRHQLDYFRSRGYRVIAPDMRGYGSSTTHTLGVPPGTRRDGHDRLLDHLDLETAIWVGHDWGSPTVWNIAAHFPGRCTAAITLDVPFGTLERGFPGLLLSIDRDLYPADSYPCGQFDYVAFSGRGLEPAGDGQPFDPRRRWAVLRERIEAMKTIWTQDGRWTRLPHITNPPSAR